MKDVEFNAGTKKVGAPHVATSLPVAYALDLHRTVEREAYFKAEQDGFRRTPSDYWFAAENELQKYP